VQVKSLKPHSSLFHLPMLNQESNIKTKMLPVGWKADDMARYGSSMATPPRVRRTSFPESSQPTDGGGATHNHYIRQPPEPTNKRRSLHPRQFKGSVPWSTAFAQGLLVFSYVVFLWYPLGTVHNGLLPSPSSPAPSHSPAPSAATLPWYLDLSARVALHGVVYLAVGTIGLYIFQRHKETQQRGYLKFYRNINLLRRLPIFTMSIVNVLLLPLWTLTSFHLCSVHTADLILRLIVTVENLVVLPCVVRYCVKVRAHNASAPLPDAQQVMSSTFENHGSAHHRQSLHSYPPTSSTAPSSSSTLSPTTTSVVDEGMMGSRQQYGTASTPEQRLQNNRHQADVVKWQNIKIKDLGIQVLSLVEKNQQLEKKQYILQRQQIMQQREAGESGGGGGGGGGSQGNDGVGMSMATMRRQMDDVVRDQKRLSDLLREANRKCKRMKDQLKVERDMNMESQRIIESLHQDGGGDGQTSTSS
jgi:Tfp pilus assembly protein PilE